MKPIQLVSSILLLLACAAATSAVAYPYCSEITCSSLLVSCDQPCWECSSDNAGTEHRGDTIYDPDYCDRPSLITVRDSGCPCIESSAAAPAPGDFLDLSARSAGPACSPDLGR